MGEKLQVVMDAVSDERAWCMFATAALEKVLPSTGLDSIDLKDKDQARKASEYISVSAALADGMLRAFHARFRQEEEGEESDDDDDDEDD